MIENTRPAKNEQPRDEGHDTPYEQNPLLHEPIDIGDPPNASTDPNEDPAHG